MAREIKFRALKDDMSNYNFVYGNLVYNNDIPRITNDGGITYHTCVKGTECQYTGLKDKNNTDIYECDILEVDLDVVKMYVPHYSGSKFLIDVEFGGGAFQIPYIDWLDRIEIIGNIYENPELLD